jgi:hypothetical protein
MPKKKEKKKMCSHLLSNCQIKFQKRAALCYVRTLLFISQKQKEESCNNSNEKHEIRIVQNALFEK